MHPAMSRCGSGRVSNVSLGGALIVSSLDSNVGARILVSIPMDADGSTYESVLAAYLVRRSDTAFAIEWAEFAPTEVIDLVRACGESERRPERERSEADVAGPHGDTPL